MPFANRAPPSGPSEPAFTFALISKRMRVPLLPIAPLSCVTPDPVTAWPSSCDSTVHRALSVALSHTVRSIHVSARPSACSRIGDGSEPAAFHS
jgi:hypothetical protein